ncbi:MAG: transglycosylase family protein [Nitriliruptorales bacterium]
MPHAVARIQVRSRLRHAKSPRPPNLAGVVTGVALTALVVSPAHASRKQPGEGSIRMRAASKQIAGAPQTPVDRSPVRVPIPRIDPKDRLAERPRSHWDRLADCESGSWDSNGKPIENSARWNYGAGSGGGGFEGGLNFHPGTWDAYRRPNMPAHAGLASKGHQIEVAERVLASQGWSAWPRCSRKLGLR